MKALILGALLALFLLWQPALSLTVVEQPAVLAFALGVLARPAIARRARRWLT